ncbi:hypothetical protein [Streptomyces sp. NPDC058424]|uniref:hypothetical protein n=1 Tax=Streptomyces sp. NPDC058424 TaxID=3346491 RepID=UPI003667D28E
MAPLPAEWPENADRYFVQGGINGLTELLAQIDRLRDDLAELDARARRVAISHQHFIDDHEDPGTEALAAQYELVNHLSPAATRRSCRCTRSRTRSASSSRCWTSPTRTSPPPRSARRSPGPRSR